MLMTIYILRTSFEGVLGLKGLTYILFDVLQTMCFSERNNCFLNSGTYQPALEDNSQTKLGQTFDVHEQCKLIHGKNYYFLVWFMHVCAQIVFRFLSFLLNSCCKQFHVNESIILCLKLGGTNYYFLLTLLGPV